MPIDPYYYQSKLRDIQNQRALTTGRGLSPEETTGILNSELEARYAGEDRRRQYALQQQQLAIQQDAAKRAADAADVQAIAGTIGGVGQLALGGAAMYGVGKQAGWWGATPEAITPAQVKGTGFLAGGSAPVIGSAPVAGPEAIASYGQPAVSALDYTPEAFSYGQPAMAGGTSALTSMPGQSYAMSGNFAMDIPSAGGTATGTSALPSAGSVALPAAVAAADVWSAEEVRKGTSNYGKGGATFTPWNDSTTGGVIANLIFPVPSILGGATKVVGNALGTVICTELHRQGYMPKIVLLYDHEYRINNVSEDEYNGYRTLADPIVTLMQKSKVITWLVKPFGLAVAYEMAHRANSDIKGSMLGTIILKYGLPICKAVNRRNYRWPIFYKA